MDSTNEPVAWMREENDLISLSISEETGNNWIPLYTHPVKELTNAKIMDIGDKYLVSAFVPYEALQFARAILLEAQKADKIESLGTINIGGVHFRNGKEVK